MQTDLLTQIETGMLGFSKGQKRIARYILDHYEQAAYMTAARLGAAADVSESTVVRFAMALGYEGYPEFLADLNELVKSRLTSVQRVEVTRFRFGEEADLLQDVMSLDAECVRKTLKQVDPDDFERAVSELSSAKNIYLLGVRAAAPLAVFMSNYLSMLFKSVHLVNGASASEMFEQTLQLDRDDVVVGISFPRYSQRTVKLLKYARTRGAKVITITDSERSPLVLPGNVNLLARCEIFSYVDSLVAPLSLINALLVAVGLRHKDELTQNLVALEEIWDEYDVYQKDKSDAEEL